MAIFEKISFLNKVNLDDAYNSFLGLDKRKQAFVVTAGVAVTLVILSLPVSFISQKLNEKRKEYEKYANKASEFYNASSEYIKLQNSFEKVQQSFAKMGSDALSTVVYNLAEEMTIPKNKIELKSVSLSNNDTFQEVGKEVRMSNIGFDQLMGFLNRLQTYEALPLTIKKLNIKPDTQKHQIMRQISFTVSTVKPNK